MYDWVKGLRAVVFNTSKIQFKSNSQLQLRNFHKVLCCVQYLKDTIQKQFTTSLFVSSVSSGLCSIPQRYNSKAIHNTAWKLTRLVLVVFNTSKIQFKSNSRKPKTKDQRPMPSCVQYLKDTIQKQLIQKKAT